MRNNKSLIKFISFILALAGVGAVFNGCGKEASSADVELSDNLIDEKNQLQLTEDFDIENAEEVKARAEAIHALLPDDVKAEFSVEDLINIIYLSNGKSAYFKYPEGLDDNAKLKYAQHTISLTGDLFKSGNLGSYVFHATSDDLKDKKIELHKIVKEQIKNPSKENAEDFYSLVKGVVDGMGESEYNDEYSLFFHEISAVNGYFTIYLNNEQAAFLDGANSYIYKIDNQMGFGVMPKNAKVADSIDNVVNNDKPARTGEKYIASDAAPAAQIQPADPVTETKVVDKGGKPAGTISEPITSGGSDSTPAEPKEPVTETSTFVVPLPDDVEEYEVVIEEGGIPAGEAEYQDADQKEAPTKKLQP